MGTAFATAYETSLAAGLLILDDFAFRPYSQQETELLCARCDGLFSEGSISATSNRPSDGQPKF